MPDLPDWIGRFVGLPYLEGGTTLEGCDCWGLFALVRELHFGRPVPVYRGPTWHAGQDPKALGEAAEAYSRQFAAVELGQEEAGDGILLRMRGQPMHLGMIVAPGWMLHAEEEVGSSLEEYGRFTWRNRILGVYRHV